MKLKNFAMITKDKVTDFFCIADDFHKVFNAQMTKYPFKEKGMLNITLKVAYQAKS